MSFEREEFSRNMMRDKRNWRREEHDYRRDPPGMPYKEFHRNNYNYPNRRRFTTGKMYDHPERRGNREFRSSREFRDREKESLRDSRENRNSRESFRDSREMRDPPPKEFYRDSPNFSRDFREIHRDPPREMREPPPREMREMRDPPTREMREMRDPPREMREPPPREMREMRDPPPREMRDPPPREMREMRDPPREMRDLRDLPPSREIRDPPPREIRNIPRDHLRDLPPSREMRDLPPREMRDLPPRRESLNYHARDSYRGDSYMNTPRDPRDFQKEIRGLPPRIISRETPRSDINREHFLSADPKMNNNNNNNNFRKTPQRSEKDLKNSPSQSFHKPNENNIMNQNQRSQLQLLVNMLNTNNPNFDKDRSLGDVVNKREITQSTPSLSLDKLEAGGNQKPLSNSAKDLSNLTEKRSRVAFGAGLISFEQKTPDKLEEEEQIKPKEELPEQTPTETEKNDIKPVSILKNSLATPNPQTQEKQSPPNDPSPNLPINNNNIQNLTPNNPNAPINPQNLPITSQNMNAKAPTTSPIHHSNQNLQTSNSKLQMSNPNLSSQDLDRKILESPRPSDSKNKIELTTTPTKSESESEIANKEVLLQRLEKIDGKINNLESDLDDLRSYNDEEHKHMEKLSLIDRIYEHNKQAKRKSEISEFAQLLSKPIVETIENKEAPIYKQISEYPFYNENIEKHEKFKDKLKEVLKRREIKRTDKENKLTLKYKKLYIDWKDRTDMQEKKILETKASKLFQQNQKQIRNRKSSRFNNQAQNNLDYESIFDKNGKITSDEAFFQVSNFLCQPHSQDLNRRFERTLVSIPNQILDDQLKSKFLYEDETGRIEDCIADEKHRTLLNPWCDKEKHIFLNMYVRFPKQFPKISSLLPNKTNGEVISYYYNIKRRLDLKNLVLKFQKAKKKGNKNSSKHLKNLKELGLTLDDNFLDGIKIEEFQISNYSSMSYAERSQSRANNFLNKPAQMKPKPKEEQVIELDTLVKWTEKEKKTFLITLKAHGKNWKKLSASLPNKTQNQCKNFFNNHRKKLKMDKLLEEFKLSQTKKEKSKNDQDLSFSDEELEKKPRRTTGAYWKQAEKEKFVTLLKKYGPKWKTITSHLNGKTISQVRNYYENHKIKQGFDGIVKEFEKNKKAKKKVAPTQQPPKRKRSTEPQEKDSQKEDPKKRSKEQKKNSKELKKRKTSKEEIVIDDISQSKNSLYSELIKNSEEKIEIDDENVVIDDDTPIKRESPNTPQRNPRLEPKSLLQSSPQLASTKIENSAQNSTPKSIPLTSQSNPSNNQITSSPRTVPKVSPNLSSSNENLNAPKTVPQTTQKPTDSPSSNTSNPQKTVSSNQSSTSSTSQTPSENQANTTTTTSTSQNDSSNTQISPPLQKQNQTVQNSTTQTAPKTQNRPVPTQSPTTSHIVKNEAIKKEILNKNVPPKSNPNVELRKTEAKKTSNNTPPSFSGINKNKQDPKREPTKKKLSPILPKLSSNHSKVMSGMNYNPFEKKDFPPESSKSSSNKKSDSEKKDKTPKRKSHDSISSSQSNTHSNSSGNIQIPRRNSAQNENNSSSSNLSQSLSNSNNSLLLSNSSSNNNIHSTLSSKIEHPTMSSSPLLPSLNQNSTLPSLNQNSTLPSLQNAGVSSLPSLNQSNTLLQSLGQYPPISSQLPSLQNNPLLNFHSILNPSMNTSNFSSFQKGNNISLPPLTNLFQQHQEMNPLNTPVKSNLYHFPNLMHPQLNTLQQNSSLLQNDQFNRLENNSTSSSSTTPSTSSSNPLRSDLQSPLSSLSSKFSSNNNPQHSFLPFSNNNGSNNENNQNNILKSFPQNSQPIPINPLTSFATSQLNSSNPSTLQPISQILQQQQPLSNNINNHHPEEDNNDPSKRKRTPEENSPQKKIFVDNNNSNTDQNNSNKPFFNQNEEK